MCGADLRGGAKGRFGIPGHCENLIGSADRMPAGVFPSAVGRFRKLVVAYLRSARAISSEVLTPSALASTATVSTVGCRSARSMPPM